MVREGRVFTSVATDPDFGANYYVTAYEVGAQVTAIYDGTGIPVRAGHGFSTGDKFIVVSEFPATTKMRTVTSTSATKVFCTSVTVAAGDLLVNLAADTETVAGTPDYNGNGLAIYTDMAYGSQAANNTVQCDANGRYIYYHQGINIWELVRSSLTAPFTLYQSGSQTSIPGIASSTDNAVVRWDGTTGTTLQDSVVTIGDTGATTGITTLNASGAVTFGSTLAITGALTGVTTITASGAVSAASLTLTGAMNSATVVTTGTATIGGALILNAGVTGNITTTGNITSGGHVAGLVAAQAITSNTVFSGTGKLMINITVTSGANTGCTVAAPGLDGQILILRIVSIGGGGSIKVIENANLVLVGGDWGTAVALGAGDTLTLVSSGTVWYEISRSDN